MDILGLLSGGAGSVAGGLFGGLFGLGKFWLESKDKHKTADREAAERDRDRVHDLALADKEIERAGKEAQISMAAVGQENDFKLSEQDMANLQADIEAQKVEQKTIVKIVGKLTGIPLAISGGLLMFAEFIRKLMRPALTAALVCTVIKLCSEMGISVGDLPASERLDIFRQVVNAILSMTSAAVFFWFVSRPHQGSK